MKRAKTLIYKDFSFDDNTYSFVFLIDDKEYVVGITHSVIPTLPQGNKAHIVSHMGMCILLDIAEITLPYSIHVEITFNEKQLAFWKDIYEELIREKIYRDRLHIQDIETTWQIEKNSESPFSSFFIKQSRRKILLCLTGGKESLSALKLLEDHMELGLFFLDPDRDAYRKKVEKMTQQILPTLSSTTTFEQTYQKLIRLYGNMYSGFDMGHLVFQSLLFSDQYCYVLLCNEYSANFENTTYEGVPINHQYVKTTYLAKKINTYIHQWITPDYNYFSPFFDLYEYKIIEYFLRDQKYLYLWTSCNYATQQVNFCCRCFKCAFTYIIALAHSNKTFLKNYFTYDLLQNLSLNKPLMDPKHTKPFECVGEKKEVWVALYKIYQEKKDINSPTMRYFLKNIYPIISQDLQKLEHEVTRQQKTPIVLPLKLRQIVENGLLEKPRS